MKVICPHTALHPVTKGVLDSYNLGVRYVQLDAEYAYGNLLRELWAERETVVIIEHDIVPNHGCVEELFGCSAIWCAFSYQWRNEFGEVGVGLSHQLGCTKISAHLMNALPDLWNEPCHWSLCDQRLFFAAREIGREPHLHRPAVIHLKGIAV
jgi:hypothetical protein